VTAVWWWPQGRDIIAHPAQPLEAPDQPFVGVLGVRRGGAPGVEALGTAQRVHEDVHVGGLARDPRPLHGPVRLQLSPRRGFEAHRGPAQAQPALGRLAQEAEPACMPPTCSSR